MGNFLDYSKFTSGYGKGGSKKGNLDIDKITLATARSYTELKFGKFGKVLSKQIPKFDQNFKKIKESLKSAFIKRKDMPVFDTEDIKDLQLSLIRGKLDINPPFAPTTKSSDLFPNGLSGEKAADFLERGLHDGSKTDDQVIVKSISEKLGNLIPIQSEIYLDKCVPRMAENGSKDRIRWIKSTIFLISNDNFIIDGHHRFATGMLIDPKMKVNCVSIDLPIMKLINLATAFTDAKGKMRNESNKNRSRSFDVF